MLHRNFEDVLLNCARPTDLAHSLWARVVRRGDLVVDCTVGNGHDTLVLAQVCIVLYCIVFTESACTDATGTCSPH